MTTPEVDLSQLLGEESDPVEFPSGLIGIEEWKRFILVSHIAGGPLRLLQSLEDERMSLIVINPYLIDEDYGVVLSAEDKEALQYHGADRLSADGGLEVYCVLSVQEEPFNVTVNLLGPVLINRATGIGRQVVLTESGYSTRHLIADAGMPGVENKVPNYLETLKENETMTTPELDFSQLLGEESKPVEFPAGLIGIEEWKRFTLISHLAGGPLRLLQSLEDERMSLIVINPYLIDENYRVALSATDKEALQYHGADRLSADCGLEIYCVLSVEEEPFNVTANLLGPIVINMAAGVGRQVILTDSGYKTRHPVANANSIRGE